MGASASGKSVLLQVLCGRIQDLSIAGDCYMDGKNVNPKSLDNPIAFVPQENSVIGELTAREMMMNSAVLKRKEPRETLANDVQILLEKMGLSKVADASIGTLFFVRRINILICILSYKSKTSNFHTSIQTARTKRRSKKKSRNWFRADSFASYIAA